MKGGVDFGDKVKCCKFFFCLKDWKLILGYCCQGVDISLQLVAVSKIKDHPYNDGCRPPPEMHHHQHRVIARRPRTMSDPRCHTSNTWDWASSSHIGP